MTTNWLHLDETRESWVFLILGGGEIGDDNLSVSAEQGGQLGYWEVGIGNADSLVSTAADRIDSKQSQCEAAIAESLIAELDQFRYQDTLLITVDNRTPCWLRRRLAACAGDSTPSLRGFRHVSLEEQLRQYFNQELQDYDLNQSSRSLPRLSETHSKEVVSTGAAREFWEVWRKVFRLLPTSAVRGEQL